MKDIEILTEDIVEEVLGFLTESPVRDLQSVINHDELYELCYTEAIGRLTDEAEAYVEEEKMKDLYEIN